MQSKSISNTIEDVRINDHLTLRYRKVGTGPPLVLLHTIRTQLEYFDQLVPRLAKDFTVYALDLPGHGQSSVDNRASYDEPYLRGGVIAFLEKLDLTNVTLVGESIGGVLALTVAATVPDRVAQVFSLNAYDYEHRYADGVRRGNVFANLAIGSYAVPVLGAVNAAIENRVFLRWALNGGLYNNANLPLELLKQLDRAGRRKGYRYVERKVFQEWRSWDSARALYANVRAPVTLIYGDHDWSKKVERQRTADSLANPRVITLKETGHFSVLERPAEIAEIIQGGSIAEQRAVS